MRLVILASGASPESDSGQAGMTVVKIRNVIPASPDFYRDASGISRFIMNNKLFAVYIMANQRPTLYTGFCNNLFRRVWEHKNKINPKSFTARYNLYNLAYYDFFSDPRLAIIREKQIKNLSRNEKLELIRGVNSNFRDLYADLME